ncbi:U-box-domain-containing protein [Saccharata proteae CBS 121410]|uniref:U-box-domain-containing protein n=1 Tax=Saccharata proteae CBS 121410 TaxID=1314787 RepID=A0A9P4I1P6_9PEZI|nr:U-box-domain-containing protein [Saccharata proteae CBS 121410]
MAHTAEQLKDKGNALFKQGDYAGAEQLYGQAIQRNSTNEKLFTNRANARMKLEQWEGVVDDCLRSVELVRDNLKAFTYLARAQLALHHPNEAFSSALTAYDLCIRSKTPTRDAATISALVLQCKKAKWELRERDRRRRKAPLLAELEDKLEAAANEEQAVISEKASRGEIGPVQAVEDRSALRQSYDQKIEDLRNLFAIANPDEMEKREVPDHLIDNITFEIMHDPVITKNGHSYERATLIEHLKRSPTDPMTREPLRIEDLRPNILLRDACNEFFESNAGWVYNW